MEDILRKYSPDSYFYIIPYNWNNYLPIHLFPFDYLSFS